jgi:uncharacterized membrane protein
MIRALGWLGVVALALCARWFDSDLYRGACAFAVLALIGIATPRSLRPAVVVIALLALALLAVAGVGGLLDALPALIAGFVAWLFARTLRRGRTPLIGRAIVALDGAAQLDDPATVHYARRLTWIWAIYQVALAVLGALIALHARGWLDGLPAWAFSPRVFGALLLPLAVVALFLGEFALRPLLLPQAPRHSLFVFVRELVRTWPRLLDDE